MVLKEQIIILENKHNIYNNILHNDFEGEEELFYLSYSKCNDYLKCHRFYWLDTIIKYIRELPELLIQGTEAHNCIDNYFKDFNAQIKQEMYNSYLEGKLQQWIYQRVRSFDIKITERKVAAYWNFGIFECDRFSNLILMGFDSQEIWKYYLPDPRISEKYMIDEKWKFRFVADAVFIEPTNNEYLMLDWKTGASCPKSLSTDHRHQTSIYSYFIDRTNLLDKKIKYAGTMYVAGPIVHIYAITNQVTKNALGKIITCRKGIENKDFEMSGWGKKCKTRYWNKGRLVEYDCDMFPICRRFGKYISLKEIEDTLRVEGKLKNESRRK